ncbi:L-ornithine-N5-monooxygenase [Talaromyces proteolyticus]|uniref:L-ornithine-N5-monooxygenase n=1 Tax=Talaromyces proteolyticus TaxID=1131652 RepID=A0AAD4L2P8_9EURO|nr:L-ornithine-N5-monooxygenase [Talaromyces proteolyticus]KAH8703479.1 L-ornithine-N5-monooxygenase [Talaromyces proteolyticus]
MVPAIAGVLCHVTYFSRGEHHLFAVRYVQLFFVAFLFILSIFMYGQADAFLPALNKVAWIALSYVSGLYSSVVFYRLLLHPLNKFPGSLGARITSFWLSWRVRHGDTFRQLKSLHDLYGPFVRIGPNNLSIAHPKAVNIIYGSGSKCSKAPWYDLTKPMVSLQTFREKSLHDERRRVWSTAFSDKALRGYEQRLRGYRNKLVDHLSTLDGRPINIKKWFNLYSFDFMGDLAYGKSFDMLETSQEHWAIKLLSDGLEPLAFAFPVWFFRLLTAIPGLANDWWRFIDFCAERMEQRLRTEVDSPDIMSALSAPLKGQRPSDRDWLLLRGDAQLIVVAGSDTTATTLTAAIFELVRHPEQLDKLREELAPYMTDPTNEVLNEKIANLDHLNAIINETLRLHPPVPSMLQRKTPPEGITIDETYVPGDKIVSCPQYVIGRSEAAYDKPEAFIPERWYLHPGMVKDKTAFAPFSTGPYGCIGRPLALLNIRTTLARLVTTFDSSFAPGENGKGFEEKAREKFTLNFGDLMISFKRRV